MKRYESVTTPSSSSLIPITKTTRTRTTLRFLQYIPTYHKAFALADDDGTLEMKVVTIREAEGLEIGIEDLVNDACRTARDPFLNTGQYGRVESTSIRIQ